MKLPCQFMATELVQLACCKKQVAVCHERLGEKCPYCPRNENPQRVTKDSPVWVPKAREATLASKSAVTASATKN